MNDEQMRCFLSAARNLSFTKAARELYMTQPTISRQIAALEQEVGTPLFVRQGRSLELTPAGKYLIEMAQSFTDQCDRLLANCRRISARNYAALLVRTGPWESYLVAEPLARFAAMAGPQGEFSCNSNSYTILANKLYQADLSLAFCTADCAAGRAPGLISTPVYRKNWLVAAAVTHPFWTLSANQKAWLEDQTVILGNPDRNEEFEPYCRKNSLQQRNFLYGALLPTQLAMARAGCGVLLVPPWLPDCMLRGLRTEDCLAVPYAPTIVMVANGETGHAHLPLLQKICLDWFRETWGPVEDQKILL